MTLRRQRIEWLLGASIQQFAASNVDARRIATAKHGVRQKATLQGMVTIEVSFARFELSQATWAMAGLSQTFSGKTAKNFLESEPGERLCVWARTC
jgi:hypothetical protein